MIKAEIIADSINQFGDRLTTMVVTFPRYILAEFNTHRMLSKNSASSRAIPWEKLIKSVKENPFIPIAWQKNHPGMQGTEYCTPRESEVLNSAWLVSRNKAIEQVEYMAGYANPTKQMINRMLEPYMYHTCIVSGTEWENFFALRCPQYNLSNGQVFRSKKDVYKYFKKNQVLREEQNASEFNSYQDLEGKIHNLTDKMFWLTINKGMADIHMMALAEVMWDAYNESDPKELKDGEWHIPFAIDPRKEDQVKQFSDLVRNNIIKDGWEGQLKIATARCARVSYTVVGEEGKAPDYEADINLHDRLSKSGHWSCFEHCARAMNEDEYAFYESHNKYSSMPNKMIGSNAPEQGWLGNFRGFTQYRKMFDNENITI